MALYNAPGMLQNAAGVIENAIVVALRLPPGSSGGSSAAQAFDTSARDPSYAAKSMLSTARVRNRKPLADLNIEEAFFRVQFNPRQLMINAYRPVKFGSGSNPAPTEQGAQPAAPGTGQTPPPAPPVSTATDAPFVTTPSPPHYTLDVPLIFDQVNNADAFGWDKFTTMTQAGSLAKTAVSTVKTGSGLSGDFYTVQPVVEAFIGGLHTPQHRLFRFVWGEFQFTGYLKFLVAEYTMFSPIGLPIRAVVQLRLTNDNMDLDEQYWTDCWELFTGSLSRSPGALGALKANSGNLLNISW
ncbi:MAG: hypothetical protein LBR44_10720 [Clostridiales Family XIII bacterium]|jgi:hypothetical protein|nr:hypothetical protein [Clostridiales Family XIII bacterium]